MSREIGTGIEIGGGRRGRLAAGGERASTARRSAALAARRYTILTTRKHYNIAITKYSERTRPLPYITVSHAIRGGRSLSKAVGGRAPAAIG